MRKGIQIFLTKEACSRHMPIQRAEGIQLMYDVLKKPDVGVGPFPPIGRHPDFSRTSKAVTTHINRQAISIVLSTVFGIRAPQFENSFASDFLEIEHTLEGFFEPGAIPPVDILPILKYIPAFLAPWKSKCSELRKRYQSLFSGLRDICKARVQNGRRNGCYLEDVLDQQEKLGLSREMIR